MSHNYDAIIQALRETNPGLRFPHAALAFREGHRFRRIDRNGIVYYSKKSYRLLNPSSSPLGFGMQFVKGCNLDPTGVFFTDGAVASPEEGLEAVIAYLFAFGRPLSDILVVPATCWPRCYEKTPENIARLRRIGAPLPHEGCPAGDERRRQARGNTDDAGHIQQK